MEKPIQNDPDSSYYNYVKTWMIDYIPEGPNVVLDIGCATGRIGKILRELKKADELVGIELFGPAAMQATLHYDKVYEDDIEKLTLNYCKYFDFIICGDILEHLRDPWLMLRNIRGWLKDSGHLLITIPNIRHWSILCDLALRGNLDYKDSGILDITHLRFFTRKSFRNILNKTGFMVERDEMMISGIKKTTLNKATCRAFEEFIGSQILFVARKQ